MVCGKYKKHKKHSKSHSKHKKDQEVSESKLRSKKEKKLRKQPKTPILPPDSNDHSSSSEVSDPDSEEERNAVPMNYSRKRRVCLGIRFLQEHKMGHIVKIVQTKEPAYKEGNPTDLELNFDILKPMTVRRLETYVSASLRKKGKSLDSSDFDSSDSDVDSGSWDEKSSPESGDSEQDESMLAAGQNWIPAMIGVN